MGNVPIDVSNDVLAKVLNTVKVFSRTHICGRRGDKTGSQLFILVETSVDLDVRNVPHEVGIEREVGLWPVHLVQSLGHPESNRAGEDFRGKLLSLLQQEGRSVNDVRTVLMPSESPVVDNKYGFGNALGRLVDKCNDIPTEGPSYRKLRVFSGSKPIPSGEEKYDAWM